MDDPAGKARRSDPYASFRFRVRMEGRDVAGFGKVRALSRTGEVVAHRERRHEASRRTPGRAAYEAITLERGVTHDPEFETWASAVWSAGTGVGAESQPTSLRRDLVVARYDEAGRRVVAYRVHRAWVSEFQAVPELDANANAVAIETLTLQHEGWERDEDVGEPSEPTIGDLGA